MNIIKKFIIATITSILRISSKKKKKKNLYFKESINFKEQKKRGVLPQVKELCHIYIRWLVFYYILNENYSLITIKY